jgi:hypothetical protein
MGAPNMQCAIVEVCSLELLTDKDQAIILELPQELQDLLTTYADIFKVPHGLPPLAFHSRVLVQHKLPLGARRLKCCMAGHLGTLGSLHRML